jgi:hypothetical protein
MDISDKLFANELSDSAIGSCAWGGPAYSVSPKYPSGVESDIQGEFQIGCTTIGTGAMLRLSGLLIISSFHFFHSRRDILLENLVLYPSSPPMDVANAEGFSLLQFDSV